MLKLAATRVSTSARALSSRPSFNWSLPTAEESLRLIELAFAEGRLPASRQLTKTYNALQRLVDVEEQYLQAEMTRQYEEVNGGWEDPFSAAQRQSDMEDGLLRSMLGADRGDTTP